MSQIDLLPYESSTDLSADGYPPLYSPEQVIAYISDIHLHERCLEKQFFTPDEKAAFFHDVVMSIFAKSLTIGIRSPAAYFDRQPIPVLLIGGDITSDFDEYVLFLDILSQYIQDHWLPIHVLICLGNHELRAFHGISLDEVISAYASVISEHGFFFLHNALFVVSYSGQYGVAKREPQIFDQQTLLQLEASQLQNLLQKSVVAIFGGLGFTGCNPEMNAANNVYGSVVDEERDQQESAVFRQLHDLVISQAAYLPKGKLFILSHTPIHSWTSVAPSPLATYIHGHNHKNTHFTIQGAEIYADAQCGYSGPIVCKRIFTSPDYDPFADYKDGVYEISKEQYTNFYFGRQECVFPHYFMKALYMLKKNGFYCFIYRNKNNKLLILNRAKSSALSHKEISYYYDRMDLVVDRLFPKYSAYSRLQHYLSNKIHQLGGRGTIHGTIIDVGTDWMDVLPFTHISIDPDTLAIKPYSAQSMASRVVYPSIPALLEAECPQLFVTYKRLLAAGASPLLLTSGNNEISTEKQVQIQPEASVTNETDQSMYQYSRLVCKMHLLAKHVLAIWIDPSDGDSLPSSEGLSPQSLK